MSKESAAMKSDQVIDKIRNKLKDSDPGHRSVMNVFQFNFTDADGKLIKSVVFDFKELNIYEGTTSEPDGEITVGDDDFFLVGTKQTSFDELLANNKAQVQGDAEAINRMMEKFRLAKQ